MTQQGAHGERGGQSWGGGVGCDGGRVCLWGVSKASRVSCTPRPRLRQAFNSLSPFFHLSLSKSEERRIMAAVS